jgi:glycerophosphoryl diester phosphodiesterase
MLIIAHRGASGHAPENTMAAFKLALDMGAKAIELDVHQTRDGKLVVIHDSDLKRTGRAKKRIRDLTWSQLKDQEVGSWFHADFKDQGVPLLEDVYELCQGRAELHVELKKGSSLYPGIERNVLDLVARRSAFETTLFSSFDHQALFNLRDLNEQARLGYLKGFTLMPKAYQEMKAMRAESLNCSMRQVNAKLVKTCHERNLRVLVYTVNEAKDIQRLDKLGVDGVFCNYPDVKI